MKKGFWLVAAGVFAGLFVLEFAIHEVALKGAYEATASVWRSKEQMSQMMKWMMASYLLVSVFFTWIFVKGYEKGKAGLGQGIRYGLLMGGLFASDKLVWYVVLPIPASLMLAWMAGNLVVGLSLGTIAGLLYKN